MVCQKKKYHNLFFVHFILHCIYFRHFYMSNKFSYIFDIPGDIIFKDFDEIMYKSSTCSILKQNWNISMRITVLF